MSTKLVEYTICDICGDSDVENQRHYKISLEEFSTTNGTYFEPKAIHICKEHEGSKVPYHLLFESGILKKEDTV